MIVDKNNIEKYKELEKKLLNKKYDYIIIGSGPAGVTLYKSLLKKKNIKILILEKGNLNKIFFETVNYKNLPINKKSRAFSVGGSSNLWSNVSSYFEKFEMTSRQSKKNKNLWPLNHIELTKFYKRLENIYGFNYTKLKFKKINLPFNLRKFIGKKIPINYRSLINKNEIDIIYNCEVLMLDEIDNYSIININFKNKIKKIFAKKIIICCGGIESTALILKSLKNNKIKKFKNKKVVGRNFMEHPKLTLGYIKYPKINLLKKLELKYNKDSLSYIGVSLKEKDQKNNKILNSYVRFEKTNIDFELKKNFKSILKTFKFFFIKTFDNKKVLYKVRLYLEMCPNFKNRIFISEITGKVNIDYKLSKKDTKTIKQLSKSIFKFFSYKPEKEETIQMPSLKFEDSSHHIGGLCYSKNKNESVVDKNLKIMGTKNIFVCSSAIFPTSGSVNPTMTICALAIRLGNYLLNK